MATENAYHELTGKDSLVKTSPWFLFTWQVTDTLPIGHLVRDRWKWCLCWRSPWHGCIWCPWSLLSQPNQFIWWRKSPKTYINWENQGSNKQGSYSQIGHGKDWTRWLAQVQGWQYNELSVIDGIILRNSHRVVIPTELHKSAVALVHSLAHQGMINSEHLLTNRIWFPGYSTMVRADVLVCETCKHTTISSWQEPGGFGPAPSRPMELINVDFKGPFHDGYLATITVRLSFR